MEDGDLCRILELSAIIHVQDMRGTVLTKDMHQALRHLSCSPRPQWSQDDKFAETVLVVEDELVPIIWTQLQVDTVCLSTYTNTSWNDWLVNYLLCGLPPLDYLKGMTRRIKRAVTSVQGWVQVLLKVLKYKYKYS